MNIYKKYTDEFLLNELKRFYKKYNRVPTSKDFKNNKDFPDASTYRKRFGSWNHSLKLADLKINQICVKLTGTEECEICHTSNTSQWNFKNGKRLCRKCYKNDRNYLHGTLKPNSEVGLGVITEHVVYKVLADCEKCNTVDNFKADYDLISVKYGNINVKASKLSRPQYSYYWHFGIHKSSKMPNNYVCIGFDKNKTEILKVWIINGNSDLITPYGIWITDFEKGLSRMQQYEVDPTTYNEVYQNLDITTLLEFRNIDVGEINA